MCERSLFVPGVPVAKGNMIRNRYGATYDKTKNLKPWAATITADVSAAGWNPIPKDRPVRVSLMFRLPRPKGHYGTGRNADRLKDSAPKWHAKKPDIDKLARAVLDAIVAAGALRDDGQVSHLSAAKCYATTPGVEIEVEPIAVNWSPVMWA